MKVRSFVFAIAIVGSAGVAFAQTAAPAQRKAVQPEKKEAAEKADGDKKTTMKNLPAAVKATIEAESKGATVKGVSSEKENGKTVYELETLVNGRSRDLMIDAAGTVYEVEEQLDIAKAPPAVKAALEARGKILTLESVMAHGKMHYEGQVQTKAGKKVAMELDADGKPIAK